MGHTAELWALAVSADGSLIDSAGSDRMVRVYKQTDQQLFLEEERELALDAQAEKNALQQNEQAVGNVDGANLVAPAESAIVGRVNAGEDSIKAAERLLEGIQLAQTEKARLLATPDAEPNPLLFGRTPDGHVFHLLEEIPAAHMETALLQLTFTEAIEALKVFNQLLATSFALSNSKISQLTAREGRLDHKVAQSSFSSRIELLTNCAIFLLHTHSAQLQSSGSPELGRLLTELRDRIRSSLGQLKHQVGINLATAKYLHRKKEEEKSTF